MEKVRPFALTPAQGRPLETRDFDHQAAGTVLLDVETLLELVGDEDIAVTAGHVPAMRTLGTINRALTQSLELHLKRAMQKSYSPINGLYLLLRATGLGVSMPSPRNHDSSSTPRSWHPGTRSMPPNGILHY